MQEIRFPQPEELKTRYNKSPFPILNAKLSKLDALEINSNGIKELQLHLDLQEFILQLHHRVVDSAKSYILMMNFYDLGIPDKEWHISPGRSGSSVEYFPHFEPIHFEIKDWFDYYSDVFFSKTFSSLDMVAQILNIYNNVGLQESKVSFHKVVARLKEKDKELFARLNSIRTTQVFQNANQMRNSATHRCLPSTAGMVVTTMPHGWGLGLRKYVPSEIVTNTAEQLISIMEEVIDVMLGYLTIKNGTQRDDKKE